MKKSKDYKFNGKRVNGLKEGFGIQKWQDESELIGFFINGRAEGICKFTDASGSCFTGEYKNNRPCGYAIYKHIKGTKLEGIWENYYQYDCGYELWDNDTYYQGEYYKSKKHGIGTYIWPDGTVFEGEWINNEINGYVNSIIFILGNNIFQ